MRVLFAAAEAVPFAKTGGLGDVAGSLPQALNEKGIETRVVLPKYGSIADEYKNKMVKKTELYVKVGWRDQYCGVEELEYEGVIYYFIDNEYYFKRDGIYGYYDEAERFSFFNKAILDIIPYIDFLPDIIHCNDWHTGMVSVLLKTQYYKNEYYNNIKTVYTIHNLKYQGIFPKEVLGELLGIDYYYFHSEALEFNDCVNFMKGGIVFSDVITTVSDSYAEEIQYPFYGEKLDGILRNKNYKLYGIINGINYKEYNPAIDKFIYNNYDYTNISNKRVNKEKLQKELQLEVNPKKPLLALVSRLTKHKGIDLIQCILEELLNTTNVQFVVVGTGEHEYEEFFSYLANKYPDKVSANIKFDNILAHKIYAATDFLLMPSLFEPCGLSQLIALKYGTVPIVRETGGLKDTIKSYESEEVGNGFTFSNFNAHDMLYTIKRGLYFYRRKFIWSKLRKKIMQEDFSWSNSARKYINLYNEL